MACLLQWLCLHRWDSTSSESSTLVGSDDLSTTNHLWDALSTISYSSDDFEYTEVGGRLYRNYRQVEHHHPLPSDERESERLLIHHALWLKALQSRLILAPIQPAQQDILDVRTRFGYWAIRFADCYPSARVIGTDSAPIQPTSTPPNCEFQIYDEESFWNFTTPFKLIHFFYANTWVRDWGMMACQTLKALEPGGWVELKFDLPWEYNPSTPHHTTLFEYQQDLARGAYAMGIKLHQDETFYQRLLHHAGFVNFREEKFYLDSTKMRKLYCEEGLDSYGKGYIGRGLGMDSAQLEVQLATVRNALRDPALEIRFPVIVCYAQKPFWRSEGSL